MQNSQIANFKLKKQIPNWGALTQYSLLYYGQTHNLETLQSFVTQVYDIDITEDDYNQKNDVAKARLIQTLQLSLLYFEHCKKCLDASYKQMEEHQIDLKQKLRQKENYLRQQKDKIYSKQNDLKIEKKALGKFILKTNNMQLYKCYLCDQKLFETEEHWKCHMSKRHQEELKQKELKQMFQVISNLLLQQKMNNQIQTNLQKKFIKDQFTLLEQNKQIVIDKWKEDKIMQLAVQEKLNENQEVYHQQEKQIIEQHKQKMNQIKEQNKKVLQQGQKKITQVQEEFMNKIEQKEERISQILNKDFTNIVYKENQLKQVQHQESNKLLRTSIKKMSYKEIRSLKQLPSLNQIELEKKSDISERQQNQSFGEMDEVDDEDTNIEILLQKDFELKVQKYRTLCDQIQLNREQGVKTEFTTYQRLKMDQGLNDYINECLIDSQGTKIETLQNSDIVILFQKYIEQVLFKLQTQNLGFKESNRLKLNQGRVINSQDDQENNSDDYYEDEEEVSGQSNQQDNSQKQSQDKIKLQSIL